MVSVWPIALVAALFAGGVLIVAAGALGRLPDLSSAGADTGADELSYPALRIALAFAGFAVVYLFTDWMIAGIYAAVGGFITPTLVLAKRRRRAEVARIEAIAAWVESVRDTMAASAGMQQALQVSARVAPAPIRTEVRALATRLQHQSVDESLRRFAADMRHPLSDMVVASLILATTRHAGSLQSVLATTAKSARDSASMWRQVEAGRARMFSQARMAGWITGAMMAFMVLFRRQTLEPYDTVGGQIVLFVVLGIFVGANYAIYQIAKPPKPRRVFEDIERWSKIEGRVLQ